MVLQAIPSYSMNCFMFPITTCQEIEKATARFFWGSTLEDRKTHWAAWDILTTAKANGGLGFREIHYFNIAMLAKQMWILLQNPNSLTHRILKAKYFPRHDILSAGLGFKPSYLWRSLLGARELIKDGIAWRVGDGRNIKIVSDRWVGVEDPTRPMQLMDEEWREASVATLIDRDAGRWRDDIIEQLFDPRDVRRILATPLRPNTASDQLIWRFTRHGFFSVNSAYHRAVQLFSTIRVHRATGSSIPKEWKKIWNVVAIPRVRMFIWKACTNSLPTKSNLCRRGCEVDPICVVCGEDFETTYHILVQCREVTNVWYGSMLRINRDNLKGITFRELLWSAMKQYPKDYVSLMVYNAWEIWKSRNKACFEGKRVCTDDIIRKAQTQWIEIMSTQKQEVKEAYHNAQSLKWKKPLQGKQKLNCDAAIQLDGKVGFGFVLRNEHGKVLLAGKHEEEAMGSSTLIEGLAMHYALRMVCQYGMTADSVESDSRSLIDGINGRERPEVYCALVIEDINQLAVDARCNLFEWLPRQGNQTAHHAAKGSAFISINHTPKHLIDYVNLDVKTDTVLVGSVT